jgi:hypothetical protein
VWGLSGFPAAAVANGGINNGAPGQYYGPDEFAAFLTGPDGHRIEAVFNQAEAAVTKGPAKCRAFLFCWSGSSPSKRPQERQ